jgi:hypothetical protein
LLCGFFYSHHTLHLLCDVFFSLHFMPLDTHHVLLRLLNVSRPSSFCGFFAQANIVATANRLDRLKHLADRWVAGTDKRLDLTGIGTGERQYRQQGQRIRRINM